MATQRARNQRQAIATIHELGGLTWYDGEYDNKYDVDTFRPDWLATIVGPDYIYDVVQVDLAGPTGYMKTTDEDLAVLRKLTRLRTIEISGIGVTDAGLDHLKSLGHLEYCAITSTSVTPKGLEELRQALPNCLVP